MASVLIVGAGMSGLVAARVLTEAGYAVSLVDKGRAVGGRMATRRVGEGRFDHGAQHFSARTDAFASVVDGLVEGGLAHVWLRTRSRTHPDRGVEERFAGTGGMRRVPEALAAGLRIETGVAVDRLAFAAGQVLAMAAGRTVATGDAAIVTPPVPQTVALLEASGLDAPGALSPIAYDATLAVLAQLSGPAGLDDGHLALGDGPVAWVADNQHKLVSAVPAVTIHSSAEFAAGRLDADPDAWTAELVAAARPHLASSVVTAIGHRWRYSLPRQTLDVGALAVPAPRPLVLAGEAFAGARVEGAFTSGRAAADLIRAALET